MQVTSGDGYRDIDRVERLLFLLGNEEWRILNDDGSLACHKKPGQPWVPADHDIKIEGCRVKWIERGN